ncbi:MAG TPA: protease pro-enzyme activation domain-containing protein [Acidobacteriaceae bacterium]
MHSSRRFAALSVAVCFLTGFGTASRAQTRGAVAATARVTAPVDAGRTVRLSGHVPSWANAANDLGSVSPARRLDNLHLILARSPPVQAAFEQLLADQQNPNSPRYHQWLTPQQTADQYGIASADLAAVTNWLQSQGLTVDGVASGGVFVTFSGPVSVVERAFATNLHNFRHENTSRYAPTVEPAIPEALSGVIQSVQGLSEHMAYVHSRSAPKDGGPAQVDGNIVQPLYNSGSSAHYVTPGDFNAIYDINSTHNAGFTGSGYHVVNLIDSRIAAADITGFNSVFGLSVAQPNQIVLPGSSDPGINADSEGEAALDVQRILGTAPGTNVDLLVFSSLSFNNIFSALQYEISTLNDPIVNMSFGSCNSSGSASYSQKFDSLFQTGAAQGISFFVSSGDNAAAGCDDGSNTLPTTQVLATNLICASGYATCVGGTEFNDSASGYWASSNSATKVSAIGYIPEGAWNEPASASNGKTTYQASGTGGGVTLLAKPSWQTGVGVPGDGVRDVPDVSFTASGHDGYLVCQTDVGNDCASGTFKYITFGTSASSPSMAGIAAMLDQKLGARQGNLNPMFYRLASTTSNGVFHDATPASSGVSSCSTATPSMCNNSTPSANALTGGLAGYGLTTGYDLATGLGSLDVTNFLTAAAGATTPTVATTLSIAASANPISTSQTVSFTATLGDSSTSAPTGTVQFYSNGTALGAAVALSGAGKATTAALTFPTAGTYEITAVYSGDSTFVGSTSAALALVVTAPASFTVTPAATSLSLIAGASGTESVTVASVNSFAGTVALSCAVNPASGTAAGSCSMAPASAAVSSGLTANSVLTIHTTAATVGVLDVTVTGTGGPVVETSPVIAISVVPAALPGFTVTASPGAFTVASGASATSSISVASTNGFAGTVALACSVTGGSAASEPVCTLTPVSIALAAGGKTAAVATVSTTAQTSVHAENSHGLAAGGAMFACLLCLMPFRRRKAMRAVRLLAALLVMLGGLGAISGCGSGGSLATAASGSAGAYTVTVTGTGVPAGSSSAVIASTSFTLTVD